MNISAKIVTGSALMFAPTAAIVYPTQIGTLSGQPLYAIPITGSGVQAVFKVEEQ